MEDLRSLEKGLSRGDAHRAAEALLRLKPETRSAHVERVRPLVEAEVERGLAQRDWSQLGYWVARVEREGGLAGSLNARWALWLGAVKARMTERASALAASLSRVEPRLTEIFEGLEASRPTEGLRALLSREEEERQRLGYAPARPRRYELYGDDVELTARALRAFEGPAAFQDQVERALSQGATDALRAVALRVGLLDVLTNEGGNQVKAARLVAHATDSASAAKVGDVLSATFRIMLARAKGGDTTAGDTWVAMLPAFFHLATIAPVVAVAAKEVAPHLSWPSLLGCWHALRGRAAEHELVVWALLELERREGTEREKGDEAPSALRAPDWLSAAVARAEPALIEGFSSCEQAEALAHAAASFLDSTTLVVFVDRSFEHLASSDARSALVPLVVELLGAMREVGAFKSVASALMRNEESLDDFDHFEEAFEEAFAHAHETMPPLVVDAFRRWSPHLPIDRTELLELAVAAAQSDEEAEGAARRYLEVRGDARAWNQALHCLIEERGAMGAGRRLAAMLGTGDGFRSVDVMLELFRLAKNHGQECPVFRLVAARQAELLEERPELRSDHRLAVLAARLAGWARKRKKAGAKSGTTKAPKTPRVRRAPKKEEPT